MFAPKGFAHPESQIQATRIDFFQSGAIATVCAAYELGKLSYTDSKKFLRVSFKTIRSDIPERETSIRNSVRQEMPFCVELLP